MEAARENGLLIGKGGLYGNVHPHLAAHEHRPQPTSTSSSTLLDKSLAACGATAGAGARDDARRSGNLRTLPRTPSRRSIRRRRWWRPTAACSASTRPCTAACPTHIDVPRFIKKIATGNLRGSALTILDANILGLSCSRVCPVDVLCEGACVMHRYNKQPIEIGRLQRHAMDRFYATARAAACRANARRSRSASPASAAGPASLACAAELRRQRPSRSPSSTTARCPAA